MMFGSVLLVAQLGAHEIRSLLCSGEQDVLSEAALDKCATAGEFRQLLARASPFDVLNAIK